MEFVNLVCASCGGRDFQKLSDLEYRCRHCYGLLVRTREMPEPVKVERQPVDVGSGPTTPMQPLLIVIGVTILAIVAIMAIALLFVPKKYSAGPPPPSKPTPKPYTVTTPAPAKPAKMKTEVVGRIKGSFSTSYIKCLISNTGETVIEEPYVSLELYKNDVKLGMVRGEGVIKYLKPGETTPAWVALYKDEDYTRAEVKDVDTIRGVDNTASLFPKLKIEASMKVETGTSTFNGQPYNEKFFTVTGTAANDEYDTVKPTIYAIFYDSKGQVVGVESANPPEIKRGEKVRFEITGSETHLFGLPAKYELRIVDPNSKTGKCLANQVC